jgi:hypothetical protein
MYQVCKEIAAYSRACEHLLSREEMLTEDERSLVEYYVNELSREYLSDKRTMPVRYESVTAKPAPTV